MTLDEALRVADNDKPMLWSDIDPLCESVTVLAATVRIQQAEITALRLYAPARRAQPTVKSQQIAPTNWPEWGMIDETDEQFAAGAGQKVTEVVR